VSPAGILSAMSDIRNLAEAPHGINLVVETDAKIYIGRFDSTNGFQVFMHDAVMRELGQGDEREDFVKQTAKYGVPVEHKDLTFDAAGVSRIRRLGDIAH